MMTIKNKSNKDLTKNGSYRTQLRIKIKKLDDVHKNYDYKENLVCDYAFRRIQRNKGKEEKTSIHI